MYFLINKMEKVLEKILEMKIELLCNGLIVPDSLIEKLIKRNKSFQLGRKGGAGPAGGSRYFSFSNGSIVNTQIWFNKHSKTKYYIDDIDEDNNIILKSVQNNETQEISIKIIDIPKFYTKTSDDGVELKKIALMHGDQVLATTLNQRCKYWRSNQQCKFCAIELSINSGSTIEEKTGAQINEVIRVARKENPNFAKHLTLTIGTTPNKDKGASEYVQKIKVIKAEFPEIKIHIQIEPMEDMGWYEKLHQAGANTIGIHLEILDDKVRNDICPGKSQISKKTYFNHWKEALRVFGRNQVDSYILIGFDPDLTELKVNLSEVIKIGVVPHITPTRFISGVDFKIPSLDLKVFTEIVLFVAKTCKIYDVDPNKNVAGCTLCGGCSPIIDAYNLL
jgi:radical SAM protein (TIGR04043 family)